MQYDAAGALEGLLGVERVVSGSSDILPPKRGLELRM